MADGRELYPKIHQADHSLVEREDRQQLSTGEVHANKALFDLGHPELLVSGIW